MKNLLIFLVAVSFGVLFFIIFAKTQPQPMATPSTNNTTLPYAPSKFSIENAPSESLKATIASHSGTLKFESRVATEPAEIKEIPTQMQQGEIIQTNENSTAFLRFPDLLTINMTPETSVEFVQTLPQNLVIAQTTGAARYTKTNPVTPLSIRSLHLLINQNEGEFTVFVDPEEAGVSVQSVKGEITVAYNDTDNVVQTVTIPEEKKLTFDDDNRDYILK